MAQNQGNGSFEPLRNFISQMDDLLTDKTGNGILQSMDGFFQNQKLFSSFPVEWEETDTHYIINAHVIGVPKEQITLELLGNRLTISFVNEQKTNTSSGENSSMVEKRKKSRSFSFQTPIMEDQIQAKHENGLLTVTVPKAKRKRLSIK